MVFGWGKKKEIKGVEEVTFTELGLTEVRSITDSIKKEQSEQLIIQAKKLWPPITHHIADLLKIAIQLEKDPLKTDDIDVNIATIVKRGKKQVLATIHKESERSFPELNSVEDVKVFHRQSSQTLTKIGDILGKQTNVIHIFAKKYAGKLKDILAKYAEDDSHLKRLLNRYATFEENYAKITLLLSKLEKEKDTIQSKTGKISSTNQNIEKLSQEASSLEKQIVRFKESDNYKKFQGIQNELDMLESKKSDIEHDINNQTILISRPISKYEYGSALDKEQKILVEKFLSSPFDVFLSQNKSELVTILENVKKAISLGHMSVKEPEKTIGYIDDIISKLDGFVASIESFLTKQNTLKEQLAQLDMSALENYEKYHAKAKDDIKFSKSRIVELQNEIDALSSNRSGYISDIESALNNTGTVRYVLKE